VRFVIVSAHLGRVSDNRERANMALAMALQERGVAFIPSKDVWPDKFPGNLAYARSCLLYRIADELDPTDWVWWLDGDVSMHPKDVLELLEHDQELVVRGYPLKAGPEGEWGWSVTPCRTKEGSLVWHEEKRLIEIRTAGFGAVMMKAGVAKAMLEHLGTKGMTPKRVPAFDFVPDHTGTERYEDASFFWHWVEEMGQKAYCAPDAQVRNGERSGNYWKFVARLTQ